MAWYRTGTISVTNGSATVTGTGTAFVANVRAGYALEAPDGRTYEVAAVVSNTQLTLATPYLGSNASGQSYAIYPTQSVIADLATQAAALLASFSAVRDGVGAGLHPDGTVSAPAIRFLADQDTGLYRSGSNTLSVALGGTEFARFSPGRAEVSGNFISTAAVQATGSAANSGGIACFIDVASGTPRLAAYNWATSADMPLQCKVSSLRPSVDNAASLGGASARWATVYAATGTINTSDERDKAWRGPLSEAEYQAGLQVIAELGFYQWNDAIAEKGSDGARYHFGVQAQQVWAIFAAHDLVDPIVDGEPGGTPYSFLCFDKWDEQREPILGEDGAPTGEDRVVREAGSRFGVRYNDLTLFLLAVQARRQTEIEARLEALEGA